MKNLFYRLLIYLDSANETDTNYTKDKFFILDDQIFKKF